MASKRCEEPGYGLGTLARRRPHGVASDVVRDDGDEPVAVADLVDADDG
jgi:hypothetical protein